MKVFWALVLLASSVVAAKIQLQDGIVPKKILESEVTGEGAAAWEEIKEMIKKTEATSGDRYIEFDLSRFASIIISALRTLVLNGGLDPLKLPNYEISYITGTTFALSNGQLEGLTTLGKGGPVIARYTLRSKILEVLVPVAYNNLLITYDYSTRVGLVAVNGDVVSNLTDLRLNVCFGIDFNALHVFADDIDIINSGSIAVEITGLDRFEHLADLMIEAITDMFQTTISGLISGVLQTKIDAAVDAINKIIDELLGTNSTGVGLQ